jgi:hypothetical protein
MAKRMGYVLGALLALILAGGIYLWRDSGLPPAVGAFAAPAPASGAKVAWVDLDRLKVERPTIVLGKRNIFGTVPPTPPPTPPPDPNVTPETPAPVTPTPPTPTPSPPPITLKFIGLVAKETSKGSKIAILLSEQKEILHGREGDLLAGRYRIVKIGIESIDIEDVTTSNTQRIALRGN